MDTPTAPAQPGPTLADLAPMLAALAEWTGADVDAIVRVALPSVLLEVPRTSEALEQAVQHQDLEAVERLAHRIKGSVCQYGDTVALEQALALETAAAEGRAGEFVGLYSTLQDGLQTFYGKCSALLEQLRADPPG